MEEELKIGEGNNNTGQKCNRCWKCISGPAYKTECHHIFCEECTYSHFGQRTDCLICNRMLKENDFIEVTIGIGELDGMDITPQLFQEGFKETDWNEVCNKSFKITSYIEGYIRFVVTQLNLENNRLIQQNNSLVKENKLYKQESGRLGIAHKKQLTQIENKAKEVEKKLKVKEKEIENLSKAYTDVKRKSLAWEKAFHNQKSHLGNDIKDNNNVDPVNNFAPINKHPSSGATSSHFHPSSSISSDYINDPNEREISYDFDGKYASRQNDHHGRNSASPFPPVNIPSDPSISYSRLASNNIDSNNIQSSGSHRAVSRSRNVDMYSKNTSSKIPLPIYPQGKQQSRATSHFDYNRNLSHHNIETPNTQQISPMLRDARGSKYSHSPSKLSSVSNNNTFARIHSHSSLEKGHLNINSGTYSSSGGRPRDRSRTRLRGPPAVPRFSKQSLQRYGL